MRLPRPAIVFVETRTFPRNMDGVVKCKYSEASIYDMYCCAVCFREFKYGFWIQKEPDSGLPPHTPAEKKHNAKFVYGYRPLFLKFRGGHRLCYGTNRCTQNVAPTVVPTVVPTL